MTVEIVHLCSKLGSHHFVSPCCLKGPAGFELLRMLVGTMLADVYQQPTSQKLLVASLRLMRITV